MKKGQLLLSLFWLALILIASLTSVLPLYKSSFIVTDDGDMMIIRLGATIRALRDLHFPVRLLDLNHGYGYPVLNFLYPLPFYLGSILYFITGAGLINSYKLLVLLTSVIAGLGAFFLTKEITKQSFSSFVGALFIVFSPMRLVNIFFRSNIGELFASAILPFIFLFLVIYKRTKDKKYLFLFSLALFSAFISHNVLAVFILALVLIYNLFVFKDKNIYWYALLAILQSSFFSLPALFERKYTHVSGISISNISDRFISPFNFFLNSITFNFATPSRIENFFYLGLPAIAIIILSLYFLTRRRLEKEGKLIIFLLFIFVFFVFGLSKPFWNTLLKPIVPFIQFPWRILSIFDFLVLLLLGKVLLLFKKNRRNLLLLLLMMFVLLNGLKSWQLVKGKEVTDAFYMTNQSSTTTQDEFIPVWVKNFPRQRPIEKIEILNGEGKIDDLKTKTNRINFTAETNDQTTLLINQHYYPGWQVFIDEKREAIDYKSDGLIKLALPEGAPEGVSGRRYKVELTFKETKFRILANFVSLIGFAILLMKLKNEIY